MFISSAFAQTAPAAAAGGDIQSSLMSMLPIVLMFVDGIRRTDPDEVLALTPESRVRYIKLTALRGL